MKRLLLFMIIFLAISTRPAPTLSGGDWQLAIVQQPKHCYGCVTALPGQVTLFRSPWKATGTIGLLAHNYLSGKLFYSLEIGDALTLTTGDEVLRYRVTEILSYTAVRPGRIDTDLIDQAGQRFTQSEVYQRVYVRPGQLTLQTSLNCSYCGWYFVLAEEAG